MDKIKDWYKKTFTKDNFSIKRAVLLFLILAVVIFLALFLVTYTTFHYENNLETDDLEIPEEWKDWPTAYRYSVRFQDEIVGTWVASLGRSKIVLQEDGNYKEYKQDTINSEGQWIIDDVHVLFYEGGTPYDRQIDKGGFSFKLIDEDTFKTFESLAFRNDEIVYYREGTTSLDNKYYQENFEKWRESWEYQKASYQDHSNELINVSFNQDPFNDYKVYNNPRNDVRFLYPQRYSLTNAENLYGNSWLRVQIIDNDAEEKPSLTFEVNADGYGPFFPDKKFEVKMDESGRLYVSDEIDLERSEYNDDGSVFIIAGYAIKPDTIYYSWKFSFKEGGRDWSQVLRDHIASVTPAVESQLVLEGDKVFLPPSRQSYEPRINTEEIENTSDRDWEFIKNGLVPSYANNVLEGEVLGSNNRVTHILYFDTTMDGKDYENYYVLNKLAVDDNWNISLALVQPKMTNITEDNFYRQIDTGMLDRSIIVPFGFVLLWDGAAYNTLFLPDLSNYHFSDFMSDEERLEEALFFIDDDPARNEVKIGGDSLRFHLDFNGKNWVLSNFERVNQ